MDTQTVRKVAKLARLRLPEERIEALAAELVEFSPGSNS